MQAQKASMREIGRYLGRDAGTISRELARNVSSTGDYKPHIAQRYYRKRCEASKEPYRIEDDASLRAYVEARLKECWSPEQICGRLLYDLVIFLSPLNIYNWTNEIVPMMANSGSICVKVTGIAAASWQQ